MQFVNKTSTYVLAILFPVLGLLAVAGRFSSRRLKRAGYSWDDWLAIPAIIFTTGCGVIMIIGAATNTIGSHNLPQPTSEALISDTPQQALFLKLEVSFLLVSFWAIGFIRLVFLFMFRRIFRGKIFAIANWILIGLVCAWTICFFIAYISGCGSHIQSYFGSLVDLKTKCVDTFTLLSVMCITDFLIDLAILILPLPCIWQLNVKPRVKIGVSLVFLLAAFSVATSCARMVFMLKILRYPFGTETPLFGTPGTRDTIGVVSVIIWFTFLEMGVATLTMNMPVFPGLFRNAVVQKIASRVWISLKSLTPSNDSRRGRELGSLSSAGVGPAGRGDDYEPYPTKETPVATMV